MKSEIKVKYEFNVELEWDEVVYLQQLTERKYADYNLCGELAETTKDRIIRERIHSEMTKIVNHMTHP